MKVFKERKKNYILLFDLDTKKLAEYYGEKNYTYAYKQMCSFFTENNLIHDQGSAYHTKSPITKVELNSLLDLFAETYPEIAVSTKKFRYGRMIKESEATSFLNKAGQTILDRKLKKENEQNLSKNFSFEKDITDDF